MFTTIPELKFLRVDPVAFPLWLSRGQCFNTQRFCCQNRRILSTELYDDRDVSGCTPPVRYPHEDEP